VRNAGKFPSLERNAAALAYTEETVALKFLIALVIIAGASAVGLFFYAHHNPHPLTAGAAIERILVEKAARRLTIFRNGKELKTYRIALGRNPIGAKEQEGDLKTPEGVYFIDSRNPHSDFHLGLHLSYPSPEDTARAAARGVPAGYDIMIHGLPNGGGWLGAFHRGKDWTAGCIALTDEEIEELWRVTPDGTAVEIRP
jgi:murein L,D-transpeptidase YafK